MNCAIHLITLVFTARPFSSTHNFELLYFIHNFNFNLNVNGRHFPSYIIVKIKTGCDVIFLPLVCIPYSIKQTIYFSELFMLYLIFLFTLLNIKQYWNIKTNIGYYKSMHIREVPSCVMLLIPYKGSKVDNQFFFCGGLFSS